ncbi:elongation factor G [Magnetovibrio blakemorei]|uniref:Elongation factor G n=1 Tax=Magnetovibrio blakemorei TaxID=28181 RepID=A0A1E5QAS6_9PROT|nr:elongation factor G [Magnetovibrio blakemorei]OEJ69136.1 elongation factor G [Magnetovibrio blakemorei]
MTKSKSTPRCVALIGPYLSGKTTLLESLLMAAGAINRKGSVRTASTVGDGSPEARSRQMSTELNVAHCTYLGDPWTILDCPGSVELLQESQGALMVADAAIVVCEADPSKALTVGPVLRMLDDYDVPHMVFVNKMDQDGGSVKATLEALQEHSRHPLVLREIPIREDGHVVGHVDLVSERAFKWRDHETSELVGLPDKLLEAELGAREEMLEALADFDDTLLEELLENVSPSSQEVYDNLTRDLAHDDIVPVFFGSAEHDNGVRRLWKALRHETPEASATAQRLGLGEADALVFKTLHAGHMGKVSIARVWSDNLKDGQDFPQGRISGLYQILGQKFDKVASVATGDVVALGRLEGAHTGDVLSKDTGPDQLSWPEPLRPLYSLAIEMNGQADEVRLTGAVQKLCEEDPSLILEHDPVSGELVLWGQGEMHLRIVMDKLTGRHNLDIVGKRPQVPYKETIRATTTRRARHKKQSGGHGEFGDVEIIVKPLARGAGFQFEDAVHGGAVPRQYIPSVEAGVKEYLARGPLGFPVVDIHVTLTDGQSHNVDSSDFAFKKAAQQAMREAMPDCQPVLLEPICEVKVLVPNTFTSNAQRILSARRGQILGFQPRDQWHGWDEVTAHLPAAEMHDLIIDLRSQTLGVGTYDFRYVHLQELVGRNADEVVAARLA